MADILLDEVILGKITWNDFVSWLKPEKKEELKSLSEISCKQGDFVIYFVNILRDEVSSFLQKSSEGINSAKKSSGLSVTDTKRNDFDRQNEFLPSAPNNHPTSLCSKQIVEKLPSEHFNRHSNVNVSNSKPESVVNKTVTVDVRNKKNFRCHNVLNGTVLSSNESPNNSFKIKRNGIISPMQKGSESSFLINCHLSPITSELFSSRKEKPAGFGSETDSPNNRIVRKDRGSSTKKVPVERSTSSPSSAPFNIMEHSFPVVGTQVKQSSSRRRRIKPTRLADSFDRGKDVDQNRAPNFGEVVRPLEPSTPFREDVPTKDIKGCPDTDIRDLLRLEKQKLQQNLYNSATTSINSWPMTIVPTTPEIVKFKDQLCTLANIYNVLLDTNLICNIVTEFHFILSLLNVQEDHDIPSDLKETAKLGYFTSVHECVFFATTVLNQQRMFLSTLDKASLKLLLNNRRISAFVPDLWKYLNDLQQTRKDVRSAIGSTAFHSSVCFQSDTDNRENFPNDRTFVTFRKQRDAFYEILGLWEENHSLPGWSFGVALGPRVRNLLCMNDEPANFIHFTRLFRTQLLGSCWKSNNTAVEEETNGALAEVLKCLKEGNPDKYSRLHERLVTPVKSSNSCTLPDFPEQQEFYRDFIIHGCHATFNTHLTDSLWHEIVLLNSSDFTPSDVEEDTTVDKDTKEAFIICVRNLQLLAKFLGFVMFLPYRSNNKMPGHLMEKQISLRLKTEPTINVLSCVQDAIQSKKLTLTIPWVIQFLSMMDRVSCTLPCYREVLSLLFSIYWTLPSASSLTSFGSIMLKTCLGWLFERPQLPEDLFYSWCLKGNQNCDFVAYADKSRSMIAGIDELELIEWDSLQILCPNLETIKWLLIADTNNVRNVIPPRHITPLLIGTQQSVSSSSSSTRNLEMDLEESFLEGQPPSLRKTIEFVSERIASSCVKYICNKPLLEVKEKASKMLETSVESSEKETLIPLETLLSKELKKHCQDTIPKLCSEKCLGVLPLLLAEDTPKEVLQVCVQIAVRSSTERVNMWINSHITPALFSKHLSSEIDRIKRNSVKPLKASHVLTCGWRDKSEDDAISPANSMTLLRKLLWAVMGNLEILEEDIVSTLNIVLSTLKFRRDLIPSAERVLGALSIDLAYGLLVHQPELITESVLKKFLQVWSTEEVSTSNCFMHLICPRNIMILNSSSQAKKTWLAAANFWFFILKNNVVPFNEFETQCVAVFRQDWSSELLENLALCFENVVKLCQNGSCDANFVVLLELVSELCQDLKNEDL